MTGKSRTHRRVRGMQRRRLMCDGPVPVQCISPSIHDNGATDSGLRHEFPVRHDVALDRSGDEMASMSNSDTLCLTISHYF